MAARKTAPKTGTKDVARELEAIRAVFARLGADEGTRRIDALTSEAETLAPPLRRCRRG